MSVQGLEVIDRTVQTTHEWINELAARVDYADRRQALTLLRTTLTTLRDFLSHDEAAQFAAQLPLLLRGMFYEGWRPSQTPLKERNKAVFTNRCAKLLSLDQEYRGEADILAVFRLLEAHVSEGEMRDVVQSLPADVRRMLGR